MTQSRIHPTAIVSPTPSIADDVEIGAFAIIGENCTVGERMCDRSARDAGAQRHRSAITCKVGIGTILGGPPQDLKYAGEETTVEIGEGTVIREYATINRGTAHSFKTTVGRNCLLMSYVHLAHDCHVGNNVILSNVVQLAGHVTVEDKAIISGLSAAHQFVRIGRIASSAGCRVYRRTFRRFSKRWETRSSFTGSTRSAFSAAGWMRRRFGS